jgi:hypothetical protein
MIYSVTDIDFASSILQTRDLDAARDELRRRQEQSGICAHCEREIEEYAVGKVWRHTATRNVLCAEDEALDGGSQATPSEDPLDEDELDTLALLDDLWQQLGQDLSSHLSLINDDYWKSYAQDQANELGVPEFIEPYVDWDRYADALASDYSTVELGRYTYYYQD